MPLLQRKRLLAAKIETTIGTLETLAAADGNFLVYEPQLTPTIDMVDRPQQGSFSHNSLSYGFQRAQLTFRTDVIGDGAGGVPAWADLFLPACGWVKSGSTFSPSDETPGSNVKTLSMALYEDGRVRQMAGCAGTFQVVMNAGQPIQIEWTFDGKWIDTVDATLLAHTPPSQLPIRFADQAILFDSWQPCVNELRLDAGNTVNMRECQSASDGSGYSNAHIVDRRSTITVDPEAELVATEDIFGDWESRQAIQFQAVVGDGTDELTFESDVEIENIQPGDRNGMIVDQVTLFAPDSFTIAF